MLLAEVVASLYLEAAEQTEWEDFWWQVIGTLRGEDLVDLGKDLREGSLYEASAEGGA